MRLDIFHWQGHDLDIDLPIDLEDQYFLPCSTVQLEEFINLVEPTSWQAWCNWYKTEAIFAS